MEIIAILKRNKVIATLLVVYFGMAFYPVVKSGFYSDDTMFAHGVRGKVMYEETNVWELAKRDTEHWMKSARVAPVFYLSQQAIFYHFNQAGSYKALLWLLNMVAVLAFATYLYLLTSNKKLLLLTLILLPTVFQFRVLQHDAYTTFNGLFQVLAILNFAALSLFALYLKRGNYWLLAATILLLSVALCYHELTLVFVPLYLVTVLAVSGRATLNLLYVAKKLLAVAMVTALYLSVIIYLRVSIPSEQSQYNGLRTSLDSDKMLTLFHAQVFSAIPLSYLNYEKNFLKVPVPTMVDEMKQFTPIWGFALLLLLAWLLARRYGTLPPETKGQAHKWFFWVGLLLLVLPAVMLMPSEKYQYQARPGNGYIPVYLQNLGGAMLFALLLHILLASTSRVKQYLGKGLLVLFILVVPITFANNMRLVALQNHKWHNPSSALEKALDDHIMEPVNDHDMIWLTSNHHWGGTEHYMHLFFEKTGHRVVVTNQVSPETFGKFQHKVYQLSFPAGSPNKVTLRQVLGFNGEEPTFSEGHTRSYAIDF